MKEKKSVSLYGVLCVVIVVVSMFPLSCNYIMTGGQIGEWIHRIFEIADGFGAGKIFFFPSNELLINMGVNGNAMNSNLWFLLPGLLYKLLGNMVPVYRIYMALIQIGTALAAYLFFRRIFAEEKKGLSALFGLLLYMTNPYRIFVCYDTADMSQAVVWMLMPLYAWAVVGILSGCKGIKEIAVGAVALAGIGYADVRMFLIVAGITVVAAAVKRKIFAFVSLACGTILFVPGLYRLLQYLFLNGFEELNLPQQVIMENGYRFGEFFTFYTWKDGHPGMGLGILMCLLVGIWLKVVNNQSEENKASKAFLMTGILLAIPALCYFPWDFVQRFGMWALKFVSLLETPAIFFGITTACLCVPSARYVKRISLHENKLMAVAIPIIILLFCIGGCIYQCNTLTYNRIPITFS